MFKFNKSNESGRSMVEMLGVLAIVGVLSVAGIAGYTTAMNSHRANEAINRVMRLAILVSSQKQLGQTASLSSEDADVTLTEDTANGKFTLTLSGLSPSVRTKIASMNLATATLGTDDQGNPTFTFYNDLGEGSGTGTAQTNAPTVGSSCSSIDSFCYVLENNCYEAYHCAYNGVNALWEKTGNQCCDTKENCMTEYEGAFGSIDPCSSI